MSFSYSAMQKTARGLLKKFGKQNTVRVLISESGSDPATGVKAKEFTNVSVLSVFLNYTSNEIDGTLVKTGDVKMISEDFTPAPTINSTVTANGVLYRVANFEQVNPSLDTNVIYKIQLRK